MLRAVLAMAGDGMGIVGTAWWWWWGALVSHGGWVEVGWVGVGQGMRLGRCVAALRGGVKRCGMG